MSSFDFDYRTFYTWDHSTNWDLTQPGTRLGGCHESYEKPPQAFIEDYTRLIDAMCRLGLNHLIIWGALRDTHGGMDALRRLVEYGRANGVRVAPGVGVYYEGDHEYSLVNLLYRHPELAAVDANGQPRIDADNPCRSVACPRNDRVAAWTLSSIRWLMEEVGPLAIHFETGDYGVCHCKTCQASGVCQATGLRGKRTSHEDMAEVLPPIVAQVRAYENARYLIRLGTPVMEGPPSQSDHR
jgi:hypothetical protein